MTVRLRSHDVFDTLLTRAVGEPAAVFLLLGQELVRQGHVRSAEVVARTRWRAEDSVRRLAGTREITLAEIHAELGRALGWGEEVRRCAWDAELELERRVSRVVPGAAEHLRAAAADGETVVAISDMYLPATTVRGLLETAGLAEHLSAVYVSSEHGVTKHSGGLYDVVLAAHGAPAAALSHHGDDPHSDVAVPRRLGATASHETAGRTTRYERLWEGSRTETAGLSSVLAGSSRLARLGLPAEGERLRAVRDVAAGVAGPVLVSYVLWVLREAQRRGITRLGFLSRDGHILLEVARRLAPQVAPGIALGYVYGNRKVFQLAALQPGGLPTARWVHDGLTRTTVLDVVLRLDLDPDEVAPLLREHGCDTTGSRHTDDPAERQRLGALLADARFERHVLARAQARQDLLVRYLQQEGMTGEGAALVDTGWTGRQQKAMADVMERAGQASPPVFFFGHDGLDISWHAPEVISAWLYDEVERQGMVGAVSQPWAVLELFCVSDQGRLLGFVDRDGRVEPVTGKGGDPSDERAELALMRTAILAVAEETALTFGDVGHLLDLDIDLRAVAAAAVELWWRSPEPHEARAWGGLTYEDDPVGRSRAPLARGYTWPDVAAGHGVLRRHDQRDQRPWRAGSLRLSRPGPAAVVRAAGLARRAVDLARARR